MAYSVLVVDDSTFFRRRVKEVLEQDPLLKVVGDAKNGEEAVRLVKELNPDVITMDVEMPVMDGITAVRHIMANSPVPILMFSSLTHDGAEATLDAIDAGALDFLPKKFSEIASNQSDAIKLLQSRVRALGPKKGTLRRKFATSGGAPAARQPKAFLRSTSSLNEAIAKPETTTPLSRASGKHYRVLAIGTSTGGPVALQKILTALPQGFAYPIVLVQHMPGTFTSAFAERLNRACNIAVKEADDGEVLQPGTAYLAPGGRQMLIQGTGQSARVKVTDAPAHLKVTYKPSVDLTFESISKVYGGNVLALVLTGMGADGKEGCQVLKGRGATIWAQDEKSSVVYGMPQAVAAAKLSERSLSLDDIADSIQIEMCNT